MEQGGGCDNYMETITVIGYIKRIGWYRVSEEKCIDYIYVRDLDYKIFKIKYDKKKIPGEFGIDDFVEITGLLVKDNIIKNITKITYPLGEEFV